jgi:thiol-disulfide isomerase/thioredoxin
VALLTRRTLVAAGTTVFGAALFGKYLARQSEPAPQIATLDGATPDVTMRPLTDIVRATPPATLPPVAFTTLDGARKTLADYAGRPIVLNFWATWCHPCVAELPELDRLAAAGPFTVLTVSTDRGGAAVVRPFAAAHHLDHARVLLDSGSDAVHALAINGFPTTLLIGADGKLRGTLEGPAAWGDAAGELAKLMA